MHDRRHMTGIGACQRAGGGLRRQHQSPGSFFRRRRAFGGNGFRADPYEPVLADYIYIRIPSPIGELLKFVSDGVVHRKATRLIRGIEPGSLRGRS